LKSLIAWLGIAQIISWGSLFYAIGVLGPAMRADLGVGELYLFSAFTGGLFLSGAFSPLAGRLIDRRGGRFVLSVGSLLAAASMFILATAQAALVMVAGWLLAGIAMAAALYDPAFATLSQHTGTKYRRAVTALTLFGGFASTVFWPLSQGLMDLWGWRATFALYGGLHLVVCFPVHRRIVPRYTPVETEGTRAKSPSSLPFADSRLKWLAACFALISFVVGVIAVHMINLVTSAGIGTGEAVTISMMMGPAQVAGRIVEISFWRNLKPITVGYIAMVLMLGAMAMLIGMTNLVGAVVFVVAYGFSNGLLTIVRGTIPADLFGRESLGELLGYLSRASIVARAAAPAAYSGFLAAGLGRTGALAIVMASALLALGAYARGTRNS
jgi:hypothetical protein